MFVEELSKFKLIIFKIKKRKKVSHLFLIPLSKKITAKTPIMPQYVPRPCSKCFTDIKLF